LISVVNSKIHRKSTCSVGGRRAVQDKLALDADEQKAIELEQELVKSRERTVWNPELSIQGRQFDFTEAEASRIKTAMDLGRLRRSS
jgi:hypothetical protein